MPFTSPAPDAAVAQHIEAIETSPGADTEASQTQPTASTLSKRPHPPSSNTGTIESSRQRRRIELSSTRSESMDSALSSTSSAGRNSSGQQLPIMVEQFEVRSYCVKYTPLVSNAMLAFRRVYTIYVVISLDCRIESIASGNKHKGRQIPVMTLCDSFA